MKLYLDSSALVKLVQREEESDALVRWLSDQPDGFVTSVLSKVEVTRAVTSGGPMAIELARRQFARLELFRIDDTVIDDASAMACDARLRSLDAIHLATALKMGDELRGVVTYDARMAEAAGALGVRVEAPTS